MGGRGQRLPLSSCFALLGLAHTRHTGFGMTWTAVQGVVCILVELARQLNIALDSLTGHRLLKVICKV